MNYLKNKWIFVGLFSVIFLITLRFSYGSGYAGSLLGFLGINVLDSNKMSPGDMVTSEMSPSDTPRPKVVTRQIAVSPVSSGQKNINPSPSITKQIDLPSTTIPQSPTPTVISTPKLTLTPSPTQSPIKTSTPSPTPNSTSSPQATSTPSPTVIPSVSPESLVNTSGNVIISEIGWMGTKASQYAEWVEIYNTTDRVIDLSGWKILEGGSAATSVLLDGLIQPKSYYLIERITASSPHTFSDITTDISAPFGGAGLSNTGEKLILQDANSNIIDVVDGSTQWYGTGVASPDYKSMERINLSESGSNSTNWATNDGIHKNGRDSKGNEINGTPGKPIYLEGL